MKVNKYVVKATIQTLALVAGMSVVAAGTRLALDYVNLTGTQMLGALGVALMAFCLYNMISTQAGILESKDKLNNKQ
jgi:predicted phage tail protein